MDQNFDVVLKKARSDGLVISRIPKRIRDNFLKLAEEEFADDYGMTLAFLWNNFELWNTFMQSWDIKLNYIIEKIDNKVKDQPEKIEKRMLSGRKINILKGGK